MANPIEGSTGRFRVVLDHGDVVEAGGGDPQPGAAPPAVVLRMTAARAHDLAHVLEDWSRVALVYTTLRSTVVTERELSRTLDVAAAALGDPGALRGAARVSESVSAPQRLAAVAVLQEREERLSALQRLSVVDAAARWLDDDAGDELAYALLDAVCSNPSTTGHVYLALITPSPGDAASTDQP